MCKVFKENSTGNIIIFFKEGKLVFPEVTFKYRIQGHHSDIEKKQYVIKYQDGYYSFFRKKKLILTISSGKFIRIPWL